MPILAENLEDIGRYLRDVREAEGLDLFDVARQIHIRARYLEAIERGSIADLPGPSYLRGYLSNYAGFLGIDRRQVLEAYERVSNPNPKKIYFIPEPTRKENAPGLGMVLLAVVFMGVSYVAWWAFVRDRPENDEVETLAAAPVQTAGYERPLNLYDNDCLGFKAPGFWPRCYLGETQLLTLSFVDADTMRAITEETDDDASQ